MGAPLGSQSHSRISSLCVCARVPFVYKPSVPGLVPSPVELVARRRLLLRVVVVEGVALAGQAPLRLRVDARLRSGSAQTKQNKQVFG